MNWMRRTVASMEAASALASVVLPDPGHVLDEQVPLGQQRHQGQPDDGVLALHHAAHVLRDPAGGRRDVDALAGGSAGRPRRLGHPSHGTWRRRSRGVIGAALLPGPTCGGAPVGSPTTTRR